MANLPENDSAKAGLIEAAKETIEAMKARGEITEKLREELLKILSANQN